MLGFVDPSGVGPAMGGRRARTKIRELNRSVDALMADVQAHVDAIADAPDGVEFIRNYAAFQGAWRVWMEEHESTWDVYWSSFFFALGGDLRRFIAEYNAYELQYRNLVGAPPSQPGVYDPEAGPATNWWFVLGVGTVAVAGLFGLAWLTREGRGLVREGRDILRTERRQRRLRRERARARAGAPALAGMATRPRFLLPSSQPE